MQDLLLPALSVLSGLAVLVSGGEALVRGASALAAAARISPLVIGLTVVAFGTSAPELAVTSRAAFTGSADLAIGNVVGSNIANVLLILGLSALVAPLVVSTRLIRFDVPLVICASILMLLLGLDHSIGSRDGTLFLGLLTAYVLWSIRVGREEREDVQASFAGAIPAGERRGRVTRQIVLVLLGLGLLAIGAHWLVGGAVQIARLLGVQELVIGLTVVAVGTSLPELVTSIMAALRGERELAVGNVIGSNLFNILGVLGMAAVLAPEGIPVSPAALSLDIPIMIATAIACLPIFFTGHLVARWEGGLFFFYYLAYTTYLIVDAREHASSEGFELVMVAFVIPLTLATLAICTLRAFLGRTPP